MYVKSTIVLCLCSSLFNVIASYFIINYTEELRVIPLIKLQYLDYLVINYTQSIAMATHNICAPLIMDFYSCGARA